MTSKETLRASLTAIRKKIRKTRSLNERAYRKALDIKGVKSGNTGSRSKRKKAATPSVDGSLEEAGRSTGIPGEGSETVNQS